ncbi:MAG: hypothetical protein M3457_07495 [Chloroflexota bacterium]|nr:hypothetical protein [Chloroflexota bacterium]
MTMEWLGIPGAITLQTNAGADVWSGWGSVIMGVSVVGLTLVLVGIVIWQVFRTMQTRMTTQAVIAQDEAYRKLAERVADSQAGIATETARIAAELTAMSARVTAMEKLLREVE